MVTLNNLPLQLTSFIGREREIAEIKRLLASTRLLTLTGAGGCGKTRLALEVATNLLDSFPNGVWFVDLAPLSDSSLVPQAIATVLDLHQVSDTPIGILLQKFFRAKNLLLLLDNCEHLIQTCAELCDSLLRACPDLKILATSREALGVAGQTAYRVPSLAVPDPQHLSSLESLSQYDAVRLFIDRAISVQPTFSVNKHNALAVAQICHRLDGIPLALELAAGRIKIFSAEEIEVRLDDRFSLLTSGSRTALPRQQTLRGLIDWSFDLLSDPERVLLSRLSVFAGGWTFDAAESVCADDLSPKSPSLIGKAVQQVGGQDILDLLSHLIDKSLVLAEGQDGVTRYRMLEMIRQYAREQLSESAEAEKLHQRHLEWFLQFAKKADSKLRGPQIDIWLKHLDVELENCRAALAWAFEKDRSTDGAELNAALAWYFFQRGYFREARSWSEKAERLTRGASSATRAEALFALGFALAHMGEYAQAETILQQALTLYRNLDNRFRWGWVLNALGVTVSYLGKLDQAEQYWQEALTLRRAIGDKWGIAQTLQNFDELALRMGDYARAIAINEEGLKLSEELGDERMIARRWTALGIIACAQGNFKEADAMLRRAVSTLWRMKQKFSLFQALEPLAQVVAVQGQPRRAVQILGAIEFGREELGENLSEMQRADSSQIVSPIRVQLGDEDFAIAFNEGRAMTMEQAIEYALAEQAEDLQPGAAALPHDPNALTPREIEVLRLVAAGLSDIQIAEKLVISRRTVSTHLTSIYSKMGVNSRSAATRYALDHKLI